MHPFDFQKSSCTCDVFRNKTFKLLIFNYEFSTCRISKIIMQHIILVFVLMYIHIYRPILIMNFYNTLLIDTHDTFLNLIIIKPNSLCASILMEVQLTCEAEVRKTSESWHIN